MFITTHQQINVGRETTSNVVTGNSLLFPGFRLHQPTQNTRNTGYINCFRKCEIKIFIFYLTNTSKFLIFNACFIYTPTPMKWQALNRLHSAFKALPYACFAYLRREREREREKERERKRAFSIFIISFILTLTF